MDTETRTGTESVAAEPLSSIVLDHTTDGVVVADGDVIVYVSKPLLALFGYRREELVGEPIEILVPDYHRDHHSAHVKRFLHSPKPRPMGRDDLDIEGRHANGSSIPIDVQLDAIPGGSLIVATVRDMTLQRQSSVDGAILRIDLANARDQILRLQEFLDLVIQRLFALGTSIEASALDEPTLLERMAGATRRINEIIETVQEQRLPAGT